MTKHVNHKKKLQTKSRTLSHSKISNRAPKSKAKAALKIRAAKPIKRAVKPAVKRTQKASVKKRAAIPAKNPGPSAINPSVKSHSITHPAIKTPANTVKSAENAGKIEDPKVNKRPLLVNSTKKNVIASKVVFAKTPFEKFRGLMFRDRKEVDYAMVFDFGKASKNAAAIHMFFVFFPIDVVYLRDGKVVDIHKAVMPFTPYLEPRERADTLIELPQGAIWQSGIAVGDEIVAIK